MTYKLRENTAIIRDAVAQIFEEVDPPMTVRQMFYALETRGLVPKTENGYRATDRHLLKMRRTGILPYSYIADNTRWMRKPNTYNNLEAFLAESQASYRRALWHGQGCYIEIWIEKDALAGVFYDITGRFDVPLMVTRGYSSETFLYTAAQQIKERSPTDAVYIYYFGDHDPSGKNISETVERRLSEFGAVFEFNQVAVLPEQIERWNLPTRPTKKTDTRAKSFKGDSVELDAIPVNELRNLINDCIWGHVDQEVMRNTLKIEAAERATLAAVRKNLVLVPDSEEAAP